MDVRQLAESRTATRPGLTMPEWRRLISRSFAPLRLSSEDERSFRAELREVALEEVHLFDMSTDAHRVVRSPDLIDPAARAYCKLSLQLSGSARLVQDGRTCDLAAGDLALYVTQRPYELSYEEAQRSLVVIFPQSMVHLSPDQISLITATPVSGASGLGKVAVPLFEQLARNMDVLSGPHAMSLVRSALDMLVTVLSAESRESGRDTAESPLLQQAIALIDERLGDPELGPHDIAEHLFVSLRQLHSRFAANGLTVASYIRTRRLQAIRQDLANPLLAHEAVHTISTRYGLVDASHVSKAFKTEFGESPSAYRARILEGPLRPAPG